MSGFQILMIIFFCAIVTYLLVAFVQALCEEKEKRKEFRMMEKVNEAIRKAQECYSNRERFDPAAFIRLTEEEIYLNEKLAKLQKRANNAKSTGSTFECHDPLLKICRIVSGDKIK